MIDLLDRRYHIIKSKIYIIHIIRNDINRNFPEIDKEYRHDNTVITY